MNLDITDVDTDARRLAHQLRWATTIRDVDPENALPGDDIDVELMRKVLEHVTAHRDEHDQDVWGQRTGCGTKMCFAGHALNLAGVGLDWEPFEDEPGTWAADFTADGRYIPEAARELLGLSPADAVLMFYDADDLTDLWRVAHVITNGAIEVPPEFA